MLDRDVILALVADLGRGECLRGVAARLCRGQCEGLIGQREGLVTLTIQVGDVRFFFILHAHQRSREAGDLPLLRQHQRGLNMILPS